MQKQWRTFSDVVAGEGDTRTDAEVSSLLLPIPADPHSLSRGDVEVGRVRSVPKRHSSSTEIEAVDGWGDGGGLDRAPEPHASPAKSAASSEPREVQEPGFPSQHVPSPIRPRHSTNTTPVQVSVFPRKAPRARRRLPPPPSFVVSPYFDPLPRVCDARACSPPRRPSPWNPLCHP